MAYPAALRDNPRMIFFTDFDGTITLQDTNDFLTDSHGAGPELRKRCSRECLEGKRSFRDIFQEMIDSISVPFPDCIDLARRHIPLDPYFNDFFRWTRANHIPVIVLSSGMRPIIHALLVDLIGPEANQIPIICNGVADLPPKTKEQPGGWTIRFHDETDFGHDKSLTIRPYRKHFDERPGEKRPVMLFAGDGVSDLSAARETDRLFAKKGRDLVTYCEREGVPFTRFGNWNDILEETKAIFEGRVRIDGVAAESAEGAKHHDHEAGSTPTAR